MDPEQFDTLARSLTALGSRRSALATALAGGLGTLVTVSTEARKKKKKKCSPCKKRKKGKCKKKKPDGTVCADGTCQGGSCVASPGCGAGGPCLVFLSSTLHSGNLVGGLSGGDAICQGLATAAGLPGTYKAWLSDDTSSVNSRFVPSSGPYRLVNGTTIATSFTDLTDGTLLTPINVTETGGTSGAVLAAWTGTLANGNATSGAAFTCANWSPSGTDGTAGLVTRSDADWSFAGDILCSELNHLYCFQQR